MTTTEFEAAMRAAFNDFLDRVRGARLGCYSVTTPEQLARGEIGHRDRPCR